MQRSVSLLILFAASVAFGQERTLRWSRLDVEATLDADALLHVRETHAMVFDGPWNGGERKFRLEPGQSLHLRSITRDGRRLTEGDLSQVDQYGWHDITTLRWRSRLPSDPPFRNKQITYTLDYTLRNVIYRQGDEYILDHDFAFADRSGPIEQYSLELKLDPGWQPVDQVATTARRVNLPPGTNHVVRARLRNTGTPSHVQTAPPPPQTVSERLERNLALFLGFLALTAIAVALFIRREARAGRYEPPEPIDDGWLARHVFSHPPEVIGAAWDGSTGEAEVAAVIARMTAEGKLKSDMMNVGLRLTLLADRNTLPDYERRLVDALFVSGNVTDRNKITEHYKSSGFDPASILRKPLTGALKRVIGVEATRSNAAGCLIGFIVIAVAGAVSFVVKAKPVLVFSMISVGVLIASVWLAISYRNALRGRVGAASLSIPVILVAAIATALAPSGALLVAMLFIAFVILLVSLREARWYAGAEALRMYRNLRSSRDYLRAELRRGEPRLRDEWYPYLIAFGLAPDIDRWWKSFAGERAHSSSSSWTSTASTSRTTSTAPRWTGGGGAFGGGGASGAWAASAASFAASVPAPSSSGGSGSSGSSSSSSSGGGGGGGW